MGDAESVNSVFGILSVVVFGAGIYAFYAWFKMKMRGAISDSVLLGKSYTEQKCKDKDAFIRQVSPAYLLFGAVSVVYGIVDFIHCYVTPLGLADTLGMVIFLLILFWFMFYTSKLKRQYF